MQTNKITKGYDLEDAKILKFTIHNKHIIIMNWTNYYKNSKTHHMVHLS